jgi:hypothetical protein
VFHYTNDKGYKAIGSQPTWLFKALQPPGDHPKGAYFTNLPPGTTNLGKRFFVRGCRDKTEFVFCFSGEVGLKPLKGGRGAFVFSSEEDYPVEPPRQGPHGLTAEVREALNDRR